MQINVSSADESLNLYDSGHRFEHIQLLLVLLRSLPYASRAFQARAIQVCFHCLTVIVALFVLSCQIYLFYQESRRGSLMK